MAIARVPSGSDPASLPAAGLFVVAAVITPTPDPLNQALVAVPLYLLYESGIVLSRLR